MFTLSNTDSDQTFGGHDYPTMLYVVIAGIRLTDLDAKRQPNGS